jgi:hypothetical protein
MRTLCLILSARRCGQRRKWKEGISGKGGWVGTGTCPS